MLHFETTSDKMKWSWKLFSTFVTQLSIGIYTQWHSFVAKTNSFAESKHTLIDGVILFIKRMMPNQWNPIVKMSRNAFLIRKEIRARRELSRNYKGLHKFLIFLHIARFRATMKVESRWFHFDGLKINRFLILKNIFTGFIEGHKGNLLYSRI